MQLVNLDTFVRVAELGSLAAAARALGVPKSTIGRRVESLEAELGVALLKRYSRHVSLTDDGRALHSRCVEPLRELEQVEQSLGDRESEPKGKLVVAVTVESGRSLALELVGRFSAKHPDVKIDIRAPPIGLGQIVLEDGVDVVLDVTIRNNPHLSTGPQPGVVVRKLAEFGGYLYASPGYLREMGIPKVLEDLAAHRLVTATQPPWDSVWSLRQETGPVIQLSVKGQFVSGSPTALTGLLVSGAALGLCPEHTAAPFERRGALIRVLPSWSWGPLEMRVAWLHTKHLAPRILAFVDYVQSEVSKLDLGAS